MTDHRAQVDELIAQYRRSRDQLAATQQALGAINRSRSSADGSITVIAGPRGALTGLTIAEEAYRRYRPAELAEEILRLSGTAAAAVWTEAAEVLAPVLPAGTDPEALLLGTGDLAPAEIAPERAPAPRAPRQSPPADPAVDDDEDFDQVSWLTRGERQ